ncbi:MAG TPA: DUF3761 domain-containing protein [Longimicrobium sp.]|nr:DUF3761 domain-containing protein [Longimicrobium sp.]
MQRHDFDDEPPDLQAFLAKLARKAEQPGDDQGPDLVWPQPKQPSAGWLSKRWLRAVIAAVLAMLGVIYYEKGNDGTSDLPNNSETIQRQPSLAIPERLYAQGPVQVHGDSGRSFDVVLTLSAGDRVFAMESGREDWPQLFALDGDLIGYAHKSAEHFGPRPPRRTPPIPPPPTTTASAKLRALFPSNVSAVCRDGALSKSRNAAGTCSGRGGVEIWINRPER